MTRPRRTIDVCNGDADGLCAVVQWRLAHPCAGAELVTGLKREIALLERVQGAGAGDEVLVCDLALGRNIAALRRLLDSGVRVRWFDHHAPAGDVPAHPALQLHLDTASDVCTSLLVDRALGGAQRRWALVGAWGDNLGSVADRLGAASGLDAQACARLRELGEALNYNAYGDDVSDLCIAPAALYPLLLRHADPLEFVAREPIAAELQCRRADDLACARRVAPLWQGAGGSIVALPDAPWSRRVLGAYANELATAEPARAHAVLKALPGGAHAVRVRAPLAAPLGAHRLAQRFGGAGRARAAGIDALPAAQLDEFVAAFDAMRWGSD